MNRRRFLRQAPLAAAATITATGIAHAAERHLTGEPQVRRFTEQRWVLDNIIQANGIDWDQGHLGTIIRACGLDVQNDMNRVRAAVKKYADIEPAFVEIAKRREALAKQFEADDEKLPARDSYYTAAVYWGTAMWPIDEIDDRIMMYNAKKRENYSKYIALADHHIEWVELPYRGKTLPAIFHLPLNYQAGTKVPVIVAIPGMDGFKERSVGVAADGWMERGYGVLALEGPGYWEAPLRELFVDVAGWAETGKTTMQWLIARPEVDADKIAVTGSSFGSFFSVALMSDEPRYKACAVTGTCYEPSGHRIFDEASPTFKKRFMFMSGIADEAEFETFRKTLDWHGLADKIKVPYLVAVGEDDELCPLAATEQFMAALGGPKQLVIYQDSRHSLAGPSVANGPEPRIYQAEWITKRLQGKPMTSERWFVDGGGHIAKTGLA